MAADRAQHVAQIVEPALTAGRDVVSDRYIGSTIAYQGYGRGLDVDIVRAVSGWAAGGLWPDVVVLLRVSAEESARRIGAARDRIEAAGAEFHQRVLRGFAEQADDDPDTWVVVDGTGTVDQVHQRVLDAVADVLGEA
jgi:dTMP kinase